MSRIFGGRRYGRELFFLANAKRGARIGVTSEEQMAGLKQKANEINRGDLEFVLYKPPQTSGMTATFVGFDEESWVKKLFLKGSQ